MKTSRNILLLGALLLVGLPSAALSRQDKLHVVVSILPQAWFVEAVGGEYVDVQVLVGPGHSPATFEPTVKQLAQVQTADLLITAGVPFELGFMPKIRGMKGGPRICGPEAQPGHHHHDGPDGGHHHDEELDPHFWLDPVAAGRHLEMIRDELQRLAPDLAREFLVRSEKAGDRMLVMQEAMDKLLAPHAGQAFFVFHPSFGHLAARFHLEQLAVEDQGREPGPRQLAALIEKARATGARAIIVQPQFSRKSAQVVADAAGLEIVQLDPLSRDYPQNMEHMARELARVLGPATGPGGARP